MGVGDGSDGGGDGDGGVGYGCLALDCSIITIKLMHCIVLHH